MKINNWLLKCDGCGDLIEGEVRMFYQYAEVNERMVVPEKNEHFCGRCFVDWIASQK